jgi:uncharacterized protein (UPF0276 family)
VAAEAVRPTWIERLPALGVGIGYRRPLRRQILASAEAFDFLEIVSEHFLDPTDAERRELRELAARFPLIPHGLDLSPGTAEPMRADYLSGVARLVSAVGAPWWSDHLAMTRAGGEDIGHLAPVPLTRESLDLVCDNVARAREAVGAPFVIEHIASPLVLPGAEMTEAAFLGELVERTDSGILLDLMNVHANAWNQGADPYAFLEGIPLGRVVYVHVIGGRIENGVMIDSHTDRTPREVWALLAFVARRIALKGVLIEWDDDFPPFEVIVDEAARAREALGGQVPS